MQDRIKSLALMLGLLALVGCGSSAARVTGRVTCHGEPVAGNILFSPKGESETNKGPAVNALIQADGSYKIQLASLGKHTVIITPSNLKYPLKPGEKEFPCDRSAKEWDVKAGDNILEIEMAGRAP